jgi:hypothetical protein
MPGHPFIGSEGERGGRVSERNERRRWCAIMAMKVAVLEGDQPGSDEGGGGAPAFMGVEEAFGLGRKAPGQVPRVSRARRGACLRVSLPKRPPSSPLWCTTAAARLPRSPSDHIKGRPAILSSNRSSITTFTVIVLPSSSSATRPATLTAGGAGGRALISSSSRQWPRGPSP